MHHLENKLTIEFFLKEFQQTKILKKKNNQKDYCHMNNTLMVKAGDSHLDDTDVSSILNVNQIVGDFENNLL